VKIAGAYPNQIKEGKATTLTWAEALINDDAYYINKAYIDFVRTDTGNFAPKIAQLRAIASEFYRIDEANKKMERLRIEAPDPKPPEGEALAKCRANVKKAHDIIDGKITLEELEAEREQRWNEFKGK